MYTVYTPSFCSDRIRYHLTARTGGYTGYPAVCCCVVRSTKRRGRHYIDFVLAEETSNAADVLLLCVPIEFFRAFISSRGDDHRHATQEQVSMRSTTTASFFSLHPAYSPLFARLYPSSSSSQTTSSEQLGLERTQTKPRWSCATAAPGMEEISMSHVRRYSV